MPTSVIPVIVVAVMVAVLIALGVRIFREYERGVVFTLGRFTSVRGPGLVIIIPFVQQAVRIDLRTVVMDVPPQDVISRDNVSVKVNAVIYFRVVDPDKAVIQVENFMNATSQLAQTTLRSVLGKHELDEMLAERDRLNNDIQEILDRNTDVWGIKVSNVEIKHVDIDPTMVRAIAAQAEAERNRRAKVIHAEGEQQAAAKLVEAARMLAQEPGSMQLRYLSTIMSPTSARVWWCCRCRWKCCGSSPASGRLEREAGEFAPCDRPMASTSFPCRSTVPPVWGGGA